MLEIQVDQSNKTFTICRPMGELDAYTTGRFRQAIADMPTSLRLLIDMSAVTFVDSAGLGALIGGIRRIRELGGDVTLACSRPSLIRLLCNVGFDRIAVISETLEGAIWALEASPIPS